MKKKQKETTQFESTELKQSKFENEDYQKVKAFFIILIIVLALLGLLFFLNGKFITKDRFQETETTTTAEPSFDETVIIVDEMFKIKKDEYMVMVYDSSDKESSVLFSNLVLTYKGSKTLYSVDVANKMNSKYYNPDKEENKKPTNPSEVSFAGPRLIIMSNGVVVDYIEDTDTIVKKMTEK